MTFVRPEAALHRARQEAAHLVAGRLGLSLEAAQAAVAAVQERVAAVVAAHEAGGADEEIDVAAVHLAAAEAVGLPLPPDLVDALQRLQQRAWWEGVRLRPGTLQTLRRLRHAGLRLGICSNAPYHPASMVQQLAHVGVAPLVDVAVFSSAVGWRKPSPRIFAAALDGLGVAAAEALMVGDRLREDVEGARGVGMRAVLVAPGAGDAPAADHVIVHLAELVSLLGIGAVSAR